MNMITEEENNKLRLLIRKTVNRFLDEQKNSEKDKTAKWIKCRNCRKLFTQTIHKNKESLKICPHCGTHN